MNASLAHRGPDDTGQVDLGPASLAMRRLSIIDLEHGHQPIPNEDESAWLVFNGEIYNYRSLRDELQRAGHRFRTASDGEVILHLYEECGPALVDRLRGMFAFAVWDAERKRLLLARDRFGQKPLFYRFEAGRLLFSSEIKGILAALASPPALDVESLDDYLTLRFVPSPRTMFQGIRKLPPGHWLCLETGGESPSLDVQRYWDLRFVPKRRLSEADAVEETDARLREAVETHLVADVPVGAFLSGGMDSSLVVAMMARALDAPPATFAVGVRESDFDELPFAREVARHCGTEHAEEVVWPDLVELLPDMIHHLDEPSDPIAACMWCAAALASRHRKVVLTGDGGDEIFAGFDRYGGFGRIGLYAALPEPVRRGLVEPLLGALPDSAGYKNLVQKARWMHRLSFHEGGRRYAEATAFFRFDAREKADLYAPALERRLAERDPAACIARAFGATEADDDLDRMLYADVVTRLPEHSLMLTDRMTMAHGLESRAPFLDHELAEFLASLPSNLKLRRGRLKYLMRRVGERYLPPSILRRPKQGFMFPLGYWMHGPLAPALRSLLADSALLEAGILRAEALTRLVEEHVARRADHHVRLWMILNLETWYRMYCGGEDRDALRERLREHAGLSARAGAAP
jgi:asparagine synthase (glutamine-hydrolysing)